MRIPKGFLRILAYNDAQKQMIGKHLKDLLAQGLTKIADAIDDESSSVHPSSRVSDLTSRKPARGASAQSNSAPAQKFHPEVVLTAFPDFMRLFQDLLLDEDVISQEFSIEHPQEHLTHYVARQPDCVLTVEQNDELSSEKYQLQLTFYLNHQSEPRSVILGLPDYLPLFHVSEKHGYRRLRSLILWIRLMRLEMPVVSQMQDADVHRRQKEMLEALLKLLQSRDFGANRSAYYRYELVQTRYRITMYNSSSANEHPYLYVQGLRRVEHSHRGHQLGKMEYGSVCLSRCLHLPILFHSPDQTTDRPEAFLTLLHLLIEDILYRQNDLAPRIQRI